MANRRSAAVKELRTVAGNMRRATASVRERSDWNSLERLQDAANELGRAWSGSSLGYHSRVYYAGLLPPPPGARFSSEWGFIPALSGGTRGDWREYDADEVVEQINASAGNPDLSGLEQAVREIQRTFSRARDAFDSIVQVLSRQEKDLYLEGLSKTAKTFAPLTVTESARAQLPSGQLISRDSTVWNQGLQVAPHQMVVARVMSIKSAIIASDQLADVLDQGADHLARASAEAAEGNRTAEAVAAPRFVAIGHGHSPQWRELKDFIEDRLHLKTDEFNRTPTAGVTTKERLQEMLDSASFAFLVLTAEDERADGVIVARQNVVHESGLFQGRLGWKKAIVMLEEGCDEFSNIHGLGQIRFPAGRISAEFEEVRRVLERERLIGGKRKTRKS